MDNKYKNVIGSVLIGVMILSVCTFIVINKSDKDTDEIIDEEEIVIPEIKEEFSETEFIKYNEFDRKIIIDKDSQEIRLDSNEENIDYYVIGKIGKLYETKISVVKENDSNIKIYGSYKVLYDENEDKYYFIDTYTNTISDMYDTILPIYFEDNICQYLLLIDDETNLILNMNTDEIVTLDKNIVYVKIDDENSDKYLIYKDNNDLYGLIDYNGNIIIEGYYEELNIYNNSKTFIARKNKKYGIIEVNNQNNIIDFEYDLILYNNELNKYLVLCKDNKIKVLYNNKVIVNNKINFIKDSEISLINNNNDLYINIINDKDSYLYKINTKGIEKSISGKITKLLDYEGNLKYFYSLDEKETSIELYIYDLDLYEYFNTTLNYKKQYDYILEINNIENTNYYKVNINYELDNNDENQIYYMDLTNSKIINEKDALIKYFDNGYGYTLINNKLNIYKKNELLNTYDNILDYLGNYYFLIYKDNKYTIEKLIFKKESSD